MGNFVRNTSTWRTNHCVVVVTLLVLFLMDCSYGALYTNQVAVHIEGGEEVAHRIAKRHGFINLGQIGELDDHYLFEHPHIVKRSASPSDEHHSRLSEDQEVRWFEQQVVLSRKKRGFSEVHYTMTDPNWADQWYLHRDKHLDMNVLPAWEKGYTGKGVVITILDDGIEKDHPDLVDNYDPDASYDINSRDRDPQPRYDLTNENRHGTRCAGEVSAAANNSVCGVGVAFKSSIGGVRMLDGDVTDAVEAASLSLNPQHIDIYSASWGPDDDGRVVDGPGRLAKQSFINGVTKGRNGKGSLFVWASGNGGNSHDSCNCDGYTNSIFTLSVSSTSEAGNKPWYLEECSSTLATTYSSGGYRQRQIVTTDLHHLCTKTHTGTSAAAPLAAGIVALVLEANPELTWRDVQYITMLTARTEPFVDADWVVNSLGRKVSLKYGYGLMDASAMVELAEKWVNVPQQHTCEIIAQQTNIPLVGSPYSAEVVTNGCDGQPTEINYLEHVQINVTLSYSRRGDVSLHLTSPKGTRSTLLVKRQNDRNMGKFDNWPFMSVHFWGEDPTGTWKLEVHNEGISTNHGTLVSWSLRLHGTVEDPLSHYESILNQTQKETTPSSIKCHAECAGPCKGEKPEDCESCKHYKMAVDGVCVGTCPNNTYLQEANATCEACDSTCHTCHGPKSTHCLRCFGGWFLMTENNTCVMECGDGYFEEDPFGRCSSCDPGCKTCQGSAVTCTSCHGALKLIDGTCMPEGSCTHNQFKNQRGVCEACHITCSTCTGRTMHECKSCVLDDSLATFLENHTCVLECSHGYYKTHPNDFSHPSCQRCHTSCESCHGPSLSECDSCPLGFALTGGKCVDGSQSCKEGQFKSEGQCLDCHATCLTCNGSSNDHCLTCPPASELVSGVCVSGCVEGTYAAITNQPRSGTVSLCAPCHVTCAKCRGGLEKDCIKCRPPLQLVEGGLCKETSCKVNEYLDLVQQTCAPCDSSCSQCTGPGDHQCVSCSSSFLLDGACLQSCPEGFFPATDRTCQPCHPGCQQCTGDKGIECLVCKDGLEMGPEGCIMKCTKGNFYDKQTERCRACAVGCDSCTGESPSECMSCRAPLLHHRPSHRCLPCCTDPAASDCCNCLRSHSGDCVLSEQPSMKKVDKDSDEIDTSYIGLIVAICVIPVLCSFLVFIVLQLRSGHKLCWKHHYSKVPLTFDPVSEKLSQAVLSFGDDELADDEELFSNSNSDPNHNKHIPLDEY